MLLMRAIERQRQPQNCGECRNAALVFVRKHLVFVVLLLGTAAAMVAGGQGDEPQLLAIEAGQLAIENQVVAVLMMAFEIDEVADVGQ